MDSANRNTENSQEITDVLEKLMEIVTTLTGQINAIKDSTSGITKSVTDIASKSQEAVSMLDSLKK